MGMFDEVWFDQQLPDFPLACRHFQTKSLDNCMDRYIVTKTGRLCFVRNTFMEDAGVEDQESQTGVDRDFHGDIRLYADDGSHEEYVARFTHGTLEWIRPAAEVPEFRPYPVQNTTEP